jgi:hypothetical protein
MTGMVNASFGESWTIGRALANGTANGISAEMNGGNFKDGFSLSFAMSAMRVGYERMRDITDELKRKTFQYGGTEKYLEGELLTDGTRGPFPGTSGAESRLGGFFGMDPEGAVHGYSKIASLAKFVNWTSKTHDYFNSWSYDWETGFFTPFQSQFAAEAFEVYSFVGMPVAGAYTAMALTANLPTGALHGI